MLNTTTRMEKMERRPACGQCGGTGYVYLWAVPRVGPREWFCDRCKRFWVDGELTVAALMGDQVEEPAAAAGLATAEQQSLEPVTNGAGADEPSQPGPRRLRVVGSNGVKATTAPPEKLPL